MLHFEKFSETEMAVSILRAEWIKIKSRVNLVASLNFMESEHNPYFWQHFASLIFHMQMKLEDDFAAHSFFLVSFYVKFLLVLFYVKFWLMLFYVQNHFHLLPVSCADAQIAGPSHLIFFTSFYTRNDCQGLMCSICQTFKEKP